MDDTAMQKDDLIDLQGKALLKQGFSNKNLDEFWCSQTAAYPVLAKKAFSLDPICYNLSLRIWIFNIGQCEDKG
jgi:hypothetical protein